MTKEIKHTPTPWVTEDRREKGEGTSIKSPTAHYSSCLVAHYISEIDATHIVKCVNAHDDLVAALGASMSYIRSITSSGDDVAGSVISLCDRALKKVGAE